MASSPIELGGTFDGKKTKTNSSAHRNEKNEAGKNYVTEWERKTSILFTKLHTLSGLESKTGHVK